MIGLRLLMIFLCLSGLVHVFSILALPYFADQKIWNELTQSVRDRNFLIMESPEDVQELLGQVDPSMEYAICWFNLTEGPVTLQAQGNNTFWNVTVFDENAQLLFGVHDGASVHGNVDLILYDKAPNGEEILEIKKPFQLERLDATRPLPDPKPLTDEEEADIREAQRLEREEDPTIQVEIEEDQAFAVLKVFRPSRAYKKTIRQSLQAATCS